MKQLFTAIALVVAGFSFGMSVGLSETLLQPEVTQFKDSKGVLFGPFRMWEVIGDGGEVYQVCLQANWNDENLWMHKQINLTAVEYRRIKPILDRVWNDSELATE